jgi:hypothetical protein
VGRLRHAVTYDQDERGIACRARAPWRRRPCSSRALEKGFKHLANVLPHPQPARPTTRSHLTPQASRAATDGPVDSHPGAAPRPGEQHVGVSEDSRPAARLGRQGRRVDGLGDPSRCRDRPGTRTRLAHLDVVSPLASQSHPRGRLLRNSDVDRDAAVRPGCHRTCHPPHPHPRRHRPPDRRLGHPGHA